MDGKLILFSFSLPSKYFPSGTSLGIFSVQLKFEENAIGIIQYFSKAVSYIVCIYSKYSCL